MIFIEYTKRVLLIGPNAFSLGFFSMGFNWGVRRLHLCTWPLRRRCFVFFFSLFLMRYALLQKWDESKLFMAWKLLLIKITKHHIDFLKKTIRFRTRWHVGTSRAPKNAYDTALLHMHIRSYLILYFYVLVEKSC